MTKVSHAIFPIELLEDLLRFTEWADAAVWRAVLAHPAACEDETIRKYLVHIHSAQRGFLSAWKGEPPSFLTGTEFETLHALRDYAREYYPQVRAYVAALGIDTDHTVKLPWLAEYEEQTGHTFGTTSLGETIFQVVSHGTYHRGQVNARLRALGGEPPLVDYIAWVWFARADAQW